MKNAIFEFGVPDITSANYFSNGTVLNATLWLAKPFSEHPRQFNEVDYGMFIDSDFNSVTGFGGIDYKVEVGWKNDTHTWANKVEKWGPLDTDKKVVENTLNYTNFYDRNSTANYVTLSVNLDKILSPDKYKIIFYADARKSNGDLIIDYTRWVAIPPLQLFSYTIPSSIELTQGEKSNIIIRLNSTEGYEPIVNLSAKIPDKNIIATFEQTKSSNISNFHIASDGMGIARLSIYPGDNASLGPSILFINAASRFPPGELLNVSGSQPVDPEKVISRSSLSLLVNKAPDWLDKVSNVWSKIGDFTSFVYGAIVGISPFIYTQIRKRFANEKKQEPKQES
jgi:hypothetical protein